MVAVFRFGSLLKKRKKKQPKIDEAVYTSKNGVYKDRPHVSEMLPWIAIYPKQLTSNTLCNLVLGNDYSLFSVFKFRGPDMASATDAELMLYNSQINNILKTLPTGFVIYFDAQRHYAQDYESSEMPNALAQEFDDERRDYYRSQLHFDSDYYFVFYHVPPAFLQNRFLEYFTATEKDKKTKRYSKNRKLFLDFEDKFRDRLVQFSSVLSDAFRKKIYPLDREETLSYLHSLVSDRRFHVRYNPTRFVSTYITDAGIRGGREPKIGKKYMKIITVLDFPPITTPGLFDAFNDLDIEYRWNSRFICLSKLDSHKEIAQYCKFFGQQIKGFWSQIREAITKTPSTEALDETAAANRDDAQAALNELGADYVSYGYYNMNIIILDEDKARCTEKANAFLQILNNMNFAGFVESDNSMEAWRGTLPGCPKCNIRRPSISSANFCHLAPITAMWSGDKNNETLKGPVLLYTDSTGYTPFRLSLHVGGVGHTLIVGPSGSGKSVLLNTLEANFLKYPNANVFIFDKAASSRALTYGMGGHFYNLAAEGNSDLSFQPLANIDDEREIKWAKEWIMAYLIQRNVKVTPKEDILVWNALQSLKVLPKDQRTLTVFNEMVQSQEIRQAMQALTMKGSFGKLFDNNVDFAGKGNWRVFEMETLMGIPSIVPPTLDYLFHQIETIIRHATGPSLIVLDECWLFLDNEVFQNKLKEYFKDMRKKNTSIWIATQQLSDIASKPNLLDTVNDQCKNKIFLPNVNARSDANAKLYQIFNCNERQIDIISSMTPKRDYYYSSEKGNRLFQLALQPAEVPFVTATAKSDQLAMDRILANGNKGSFVEQWFKYKDAEKEWEKYKQYEPAAAGS